MPSRNVCYYKQLLLDLKTIQNNSISFTFLNRILGPTWSIAACVWEEKTTKWILLETGRDVLEHFFT